MSKKKSPKDIISSYLKEIGRKGGQAKGPSKARDPDKMREAQKKSVESRKKKREAEED